MSYRLQLPPTDSSPTREVVVTPVVQERRKQAMHALTEQLRRLVLMFPNGLENLESAHPEIWGQIDFAERKTDRAALDYIAGKLSRDAFDRSLRSYESACRRGSEALRRSGGTHGEAA
jgi:hypothetical protein